MAEDIKMNAFQTVTSAKYVYVEKADSSQGKMEMGNLPHPNTGSWKVQVNDIGWYRVLKAEYGNSNSFLVNIVKDWYSGPPESSLVYASFPRSIADSSLRLLGGKSRYISKCRVVFADNKFYFDIYNSISGSNPITLFYTMLSSSVTFVGEKVDIEYSSVLELAL